MKQQDLCMANFCEIFGFDSNGFPVSRFNVNIGEKQYPKDHVFKPGNLYGGWNIIGNIDNLVLLEYIFPDIVNICFFLPEGNAKKTFVNCHKDNPIYRFSEKQYVEEALYDGKFLIKSAIDYIRSELDSARQDNELIHTETRDSANTTITILKSGKQIKPIGDIKIQKLFQVDSYILCFSYVYDERFYTEFPGTDSCLVIRNTEEFSKRIHTWFSQHFPNFIGIDSRVSYGRKENHLGPLFSKSKQFIFQREYRFAWHPLKSNDLIDINAIASSDENYLRKIANKPITISIGNLEDIAEIKYKK